MADSPTKDTNGPLKLSISVDGTALDETVNIVSVTVSKSLNRIPYAQITVLDGDMPEGKFPLSDQGTFTPGSEVSISAGYDSSETVIFKGCVIKHSVKISGDNYSRLVIECRDKSYATTIGRKNQNFLAKTDSDIMSEVLANYAFDSSITSTTSTYSELVQYYCSDWDFVLSRAEVNGFVVQVDDGSVTIAPPDGSASPILSVAYGVDLLEFNAELNARSQLSSVNTVAWNSAEQKIVEESVSPITINQQGDLDGNTLADVLKLSNFQLQSPSTLDSAALKNWATGQQTKAALSRITGKMTFQGNALPKPGCLIEVAGVGNHFNGNVYVSGIQHTIRDGNWMSEVEFGMSSNWFSENRDLTAPPASGLVPGIEGLHIGIVQQLTEDPDSHFRIKVSTPVQKATTDGIWARVASTYASNNMGIFFMPEIGDEVILGFLNNDPSSPIVLGSLYSAKNVPPIEQNDTNDNKAIVSRSQIKVTFDDAKPCLTIETPNNNIITLDDDAGSMSLKDENDNSITMDSNGIEISSNSDLTLSATGKIDMSANADITQSATGDFSASGTNVDLNANASLKAQGQASAELSASGQTTVKGAMVMIN